MNPRPNEQRDADELDAARLDLFWDELVLGRSATPAGTPEEEMVLTLQHTMALDDPSAESRLHGLIFGNAPHAEAAAPVQGLPKPKPEPIRPSWSIRKYTQLAAAALAVFLVGALVAAQNAGFFGSGGNDDTPTAIPAAIAQLDATPAAIASPTVSNDAILWSLPFDGENVEIGGTALADGTLYRLIRSDSFTGIQAVDTATGTEKWRSEQEVSGYGLGADESGVYLPVVSGVVGLDVVTGAQRLNTVTQSQPWSLAVGNGHAYVWDGQSTLAAVNLTDGTIAWQGIADVDTSSSSVFASQPPVVTETGIAAVSGTGTVALFDIDGNPTGVAGTFEPETIELAATSSGDIAAAGVQRLESGEPWMRSLMLVNPADGSTIWQTDYNATVTGLAVTDSMTFILTDNPGMAYSATEDDFEYPAQTSPQIYGFDLATGEMHFDTDESTGTGHGWAADAGSPPYVALANGPAGPIANSQSGQLSFFETENPMVQAVVTLPGALSNQIASDDAAVYVSQDDGTVSAVAPTLTNLEPQPVNLAGNLDWSIPLDGQLVDFGGMAYGEGLVYRLIDAGAGPHIEATYAATGQPAWTLPFEWSTAQLVADPGPDPFDPAQTWTGSGNIFAIDAENRLIAIDGSTGSLSWQHAFPAPVVSMIYSADTLYVWDESGTMTALLPQDGMALWATTPGDASGPQSNELGMPIPAVTRTKIAMVDADGTLHAFSKELGDHLWSTPGFDGTNSRIVRQGNVEWDQTEVFVVVSARGEAQADGTFDQTVSGVLADNGERLWDHAMQGPLVQPVNTDETLVVVTADQLRTGKNVPVDSTPVVDAESYNHYVWTGTGEAAPDGGGERLFALQADTGEIVWIRTTEAGGFTNLFVKFPAGGGTLYAITSDGLLVSPNRGDGSIGGDPPALGGPVIGTVASGESGAIGSFATLSDGTLVAFGGIPFSQQG